VTTWLADSGPLVALLCADDRHHKWAVEQCKVAPVTVTACDAVISEVLFLLNRAGHGADNLFALVEAGFLRSNFSFHDEHRRLRDLMRRYRDRPMAFADACLVCMTESIPDSCVWTVDRDFEFYRKHGRRSISLVAPW
jgi:predicted nucleic acid-binding protein